MKKLFSILVILLFSFVSCKTNSDPEQTLSDVDNIAYENNTTDEMFDTFTDSPNYKSNINKVWFYNGYKRQSGTSGIIGSWKSVDSGGTVIDVSFNSNGTFTFHKKTNNMISDKSGTYFLYKQDNFFVVQIKYNGGNEYIMKYVCSDNYFCTEGYSTYSLI